MSSAQANQTVGEVLEDAERIRGLATMLRDNAEAVTSEILRIARRLRVVEGEALSEAAAIAPALADDIELALVHLEHLEEDARDVCGLVAIAAGRAEASTA